MARRPPSAPLHRRLLGDPARALEEYDRAIQELIHVIRPEGYFEGWSDEDLRWPGSGGGRPGREALEHRKRIVDTLDRGVPPLRDRRLAEAWESFRRLDEAYHEGNRIYLQIRRRFVESGAGSEADLLRLYQGHYVEELAGGEPFSPDQGEASLERMRLARTPLSHAQAVAVALSSARPGDEMPRLAERYEVVTDGGARTAPLGELLAEVARRVLDYLAAGELFATRYNTYTNFGWFGASVWKVVTDADLALRGLDEAGVPSSGERRRIDEDLLRARCMMIEFLRAHMEDPSRLKPQGYWYGQEYSYLTRDMIDLALGVVERVNRHVRRHGTARDGEPAPLARPPLLTGVGLGGRFLPYAHTGKRREVARWRRPLRLARWVGLCWASGRRRVRIDRRTEDPGARRQAAWDEWVAWGRRTLRLFEVELRVTIDPRFAAAARDLELERRGRKVLFLPTHQSLLDHPVMYAVLASDEVLEAFGWERPRPCVILARTGLALAGVRLGPWSLSMFGVGSATFDRMLEQLDGYVTLERAGPTGPTTQKVAQALGDHPGLIYPMGTTSAFDLQSFPLQHALFSQVPQDVVIIPVALRGIHSLWPKCPRGNTRISPGLVEAVISPPLPGETTLLPKRRSLRIQLETAALLQAVHVTTLLNPEPSGP